ncbi:MAG: DUF4255 domain-containing protein [Flavisolibacter sp.]
MIRTALEFIQKELDAFMVDRENDIAHYSRNNVVDLKTLILQNGTLNTIDTMHITMMLVGLDEERREGVRPYYIPSDDKQFLKLNSPVEVDLFVLFTAHNANYPTALRDLSDVVAFFQSNPVFDEQKFPQLNANVDDAGKKPWRQIQRLSFNLHHLSFDQQNNLWAMIGAKYMPSVVYKVKMLTVFDTKAKQKSPAIMELGLNDNSLA